MKPTVHEHQKTNKNFVSKTRTIKSLTMRPILLLLLFVSGFAYADPIITTPSAYAVCDDNNDGFAGFDLHTKDAEIINGQPNVVISYHETMTDAVTAGYEIPPGHYYNINPYVQTLYVRATDTTDNSFAITTMDIRVYPKPTANQAPNLTQVDIPYDGHAAFDLSTQYAAIVGGDSGLIVTYHTSLADAENGTNPIAVTAGFVNTTNPQTIYARAENAMSCFDTSSFQLIVTNPDIVYIPDPVFKSQLLVGTIAYDAANFPVVLDVNSDGEIQVTEALLAYRLDPNDFSITSLEGIKSFQNITTLYVGFGMVNSLDVSGLLNLKELRCDYNELTVLNVSNCPNLEILFCGSNYISTLDLTGKPNLKIVWCELNQITALDVTGSPLLQALSCRNNALSTLDLTNNTALTDLNCGMNFLTSLDLSHCVNLVNFHCAGAPVTAFDFTGLNNIANLNIRYTNATAIDVSNLANLTQLNLDGNLFTTLDLSHNPSLCYFQCSNSNSLTYINLKNGAPPCNSMQYDMNVNPNLQFVCTDDNEANYFENYFNTIGSSAVVNSYCSFTPNGNFNTISGAITFDANGNGCDAGDLTQDNIRLNINDGTNQGATFTDAAGNYQFYTQTGSFDLTPAIENAAWFNFTPATATIPFADNNNNTATQNFCLAANGVHPDLEIVVTPTTPARPGFNAVYKLIYRNKGNIIPGFNSGAWLGYNPNQMTFVSASQAVGTQGANFVNFDYNNLMPFESRSILVTFHINSPTDVNPVVIGDILQLHANVGANIGDENPADNDFYYNQTVIGSFDPNEITCLEGDSVATTEIGKYLHYAINFENTGNYMAENVVVKDVIDTTKYDISSLQVLNTSNPAYTKITGNVVEFIFKNINLDAAGGNPPVGGHGDVLFKIKSKTDLEAGDYVSKTAKIYFDYNAPITTNEAQTTFEALSNPIHQFDNSVTIYPNPTSAIINISSKVNIKTVQLFDIQGRLLETDLANGNETTFDISTKQNGVYFLKITSENGSKIEKVVKE
jgi:uncharacterized repeat protein (TIGR01451 family)